MDWFGAGFGNCGDFAAPLGTQLVAFGSREDSKKDADHESIGLPRALRRAGRYGS